MLYNYYIYGNNRLEVMVVLVCLRLVTRANWAHAFR